MICSRCHDIFEPTKGDLRPFIFHRCPDGILMAHNNPEFNNSRWSSPKGKEERSKVVRYDYRRNCYDR